MASKKKQHITIPIKTKEELAPYLAPDYHKVVVLNLYDEFWVLVTVWKLSLRDFKKIQLTQEELIG